MKYIKALMWVGLMFIVVEAGFYALNNLADTSCDSSSEITLRIASGIAVLPTFFATIIAPFYCFYKSYKELGLDFKKDIFERFRNRIGSS